jgi:ppGpp synthetase/RelA/SpoT-type nucleotidyltranferase
MIRLKPGVWTPEKKKGRGRGWESLPRDMVQALEGIESLSREGKLPLISPDQQREIAEGFLNKHRASLEATERKLKSLVLGRVKGRVKEVSSALGKLVRRPSPIEIALKDRGTYSKVDEIMDGTGLRVVSSLEDIPKNAQAVRENFTVIYEDDWIQRPKQGYRSLHMVFQDHDGLLKEVQLRTEAMDTWAEWSHAVYKAPEEVEKMLSDEDREQIQDYALRMSQYYAEKEKNGARAPTPAPCPPVVLKVFGCLPEHRV